MTRNTESEGHKAVEASDRSLVEKLLLVRVLDELFGIPLDEVRQLVPMGYVARVPGASDFILGVTQHRGEIIPVVDLTTLFGGASVARDGDATLMIANVDIAPDGVACVIDELVDIIPMQGQALQPPLPTLGPLLLPFVRGMARIEEELVSVLDLTPMTGARVAD